MALTLLGFSISALRIEFHSLFILRKVPHLTVRKQTAMTRATCLLIYIPGRGKVPSQEFQTRILSFIGSSLRGRLSRLGLGGYC